MTSTFPDIMAPNDIDKVRPVKAQKPEEATLQVEIPAGVKKHLRVRAARDGETMRAIVLKALKAYGIPVDKRAIADRRKTK